MLACVQPRPGAAFSPCRIASSNASSTAVNSPPTNSTTTYALASVFHAGDRTGLWATVGGPVGLGFGREAMRGMCSQGHMGRLRGECGAAEALLPCSKCCLAVLLYQMPCTTVLQVEQYVLWGGQLMRALPRPVVCGTVVRYSQGARRGGGGLASRCYRVIAAPQGGLCLHTHFILPSLMTGLMSTPQAQARGRRARLLQGQAWDPVLQSWGLCRAATEEGTG